MIDNIKRRIRSKNIYKNFFMFIIGCLIAGISVSVFYNPNNVVTTGCTGLSILINRYTHIDLSLIVLVFSSILLVIGFMVFGVEYGVKNIYFQATPSAPKTGLKDVLNKFDLS